MESSSSDRSEIVFFDVETTFPFREGQPRHLLEFGAILVCRWRLMELGNYSTLIKPSDISVVSANSIKITREALSTAPSFGEIADNIYAILHGRVWAGHNIVRFDCVRIREAFAAIGRPAPEPKGLIDTLTLLAQRFGERAGDMKESCLPNGGFIDPDEVSVPSLAASLLPSYWGQTIQLLHKDVLLQLHCAKLRLRFGVSKKFVDSAPNIVMDTPSSLCRVLDVCDSLAQKLFMDSGSSSTWRPVVTRNNDFSSPTIRLKLPTVSNGSTGTSSVYSTEIYKKDGSGASQKQVFNRFDATQLDSLFVPGALVDAFFSLNVYDFKQSAGIRLVAEKLLINS